MAILYKNNRITKTSRIYLGTPDKHNIYEAELVGILLALYLLMAICALKNQVSKPSHYLLDFIHTVAKKLHAKQDKMLNATEFCKANRQGKQLTASTRGVIDLRVQWTLGHVDFRLNEKANKHAKRAAKGDSSLANDLLKVLR